MPIPSVDITVESNALGNVEPTPSGTIAVFGCSSGGTENTPSGPYYRPANLVTDFGYGPAPDLGCNLVASGIPTVFVKVPTDTAGSAGSVTFTGTGTSVMTVTGAAPYDAYDVLVTVETGGTAGTDPEPQITISLDGGVTSTRKISLPSNRIVTAIQATTGMTLTFTAATMVAGDTYEFTTTAPTWAAADVADAIEALRTSEKSAGLGYIVGACSKSQADTLAAVIDQFAARKKYMRWILEARDIDVADDETEAEWMTALEADFATFQNNRVSVAAGAALCASSVTGVNFRRNIGTLAIVRAGIVSIARDLGAVQDNYLAAYVPPNSFGTAVSTVYHDEGLNPGLDAARFLTIMKHEGITGYYVTNPNIMSGPESDFDLLQYGRVMDEGCRISNRYFTRLLSSDVRLNRRTGFILERDARAIESGSDSALFAGLEAPGFVSPEGIQTILSRTDNISTTKTLTVTIRLLPLGYIKTVDETISFTNPVFGSLAA
jgi:hypothetical protein